MYIFFNSVILIIELEGVFVSEKRLLEISSTVCMLDGPLVVFGYLLSLSQSDMYLFLNYVKGSKYSSVNFYDAIKLFAKDYLKGKELVKDNLEIKEFGYTEGNYEEYFFNSGFSQDYFQNYFGNDLDVKRRKV